jgi:DNA-binding SARP family transcriptional activator
VAVERDELDLDRFSQLFRQGRAAVDAEDHYAAAHLLGEALATWRGPAGADCEVFGWLRRQLDDISALRASAAEGRLVALPMLGRLARAVMEAQALIGADPQRKQWWVSVIAVLRDAREAGMAGVPNNEVRRTLLNEIDLLPDHVCNLLRLGMLPPTTVADPPTAKSSSPPVPHSHEGRL